MSSKPPSQGPARPPAPPRVIAWHKPKGLITTHRDELRRETVYDRLRATLPPHLRRLSWHAIGRLDADTTGLLLFTDAGPLVKHVTHPDTHLPKTYRALVKGLLDDATLQRLRDGVDLSGGLGKSAPARVTCDGYQAATTHLTLTLSEGKNRQIRRMLLAVHSQVIRLHRVQVGGVSLDVEEGQWRLLSPQEVRQGLGYLG